MNKEQIRQEIKVKKAKLSSIEILEKSERIQKRLFELPAYHDACAIFCYVAFNQEVRTKEIISDALERGKRVYVPKVLEGVMKFIEITALSELSPGFFGILEPEITTEIIPSDNNFVIVPGLAFDKKGRRIGYGKGYYDKYFHKYGVDKFMKVVLTYDFQVFDTLPESDQDVRVDWIITENNTYSTQTSHKKSYSTT